MVDRIGHGQREPADAVSTAVEPIFIAANLREIDFVERLLDGEGIDYTLTPEAFIREGFRGPCFQGLLFEVIAGQADYCRRLLRGCGLDRGVVTPME